MSVIHSLRLQKGLATIEIEDASDDSSDDGYSSTTSPMSAKPPGTQQLYLAPPPAERVSVAAAAAAPPLRVSDSSPTAQPKQANPYHTVTIYYDDRPLWSTSRWMLRHAMPGLVENSLNRVVVVGEHVGQTATGIVAAWLHGGTPQPPLEVLSEVFDIAIALKHQQLRLCCERVLLAYASVIQASYWHTMIGRRAQHSTAFLFAVGEAFARAGQRQVIWKWVAQSATQQQWSTVRELALHPMLRHDTQRHFHAALVQRAQSADDAQQIAAILVTRAQNHATSKPTPLTTPVTTRTIYSAYAAVHPEDEGDVLLQLRSAVDHVGPSIDMVAHAYLLRRQLPWLAEALSAAPAAEPGTRPTIALTVEHPSAMRIILDHLQFKVVDVPLHLLHAVMSQAYYFIGRLNPETESSHDLQTLIKQCKAGIGPHRTLTQLREFAQTQATLYHPDVLNAWVGCVPFGEVFPWAEEELSNNNWGLDLRRHITACKTLHWRSSRLLTLLHAWAHNIVTAPETPAAFLRRNGLLAHVNFGDLLPEEVHAAIQQGYIGQDELGAILRAMKQEPRNTCFPVVLEVTEHAGMLAHTHTVTLTAPKIPMAKAWVKSSFKLGDCTFTMLLDRSANASLLRSRYDGLRKGTSYREEVLAKDGSLKVHGVIEQRVSIAVKIKSGHGFATPGRYYCVATVVDR